MKRFRSLWQWMFALAAVTGVLLATGCATTDDTENLSERPWNAPKSWEGGLPAGMMEGR